MSFDRDLEDLSEVDQEVAEYGAVEHAGPGQRRGIALDQPFGLAEMIVLVQPADDPLAHGFFRLQGCGFERHRLRLIWLSADWSEALLFDP